MKQQANNRSYQLDLVRVICVLYIICIWHFNGYLNESLHFSENVMRYLHKITYIILGTFTFLSGFFCGKYSFTSFSDIKLFVSKRLKRFFLLLLLSSLTYCAFRWITPYQVIQVVAGTNLFHNEAVPTLWFFSMIIFFYAITPVIQFNYKKRVYRYIISLTIWCILIYLSFKGLVDDRLSLYFPFYVVGGALSCRKDLIMEFGNLERKIQLPLFLVSIVVLFILIQLSNGLCGDYFIILFGIICVITMSYLFYNNKYYRTVLFFAEGSMVAYLFHRQIFGVFKLISEELFGHMWLNLWLAIIALVVTFVFSYYFQKCYDLIIRKYAKQ